MIRIGSNCKESNDLKMRNSSAIILFTDDPALPSQMSHMLETDGWRCSTTSDIGEVINWASEQADMLLIDGRNALAACATLVARVRALEGFASSLPILLYADEPEEECRGINDRLAPPLDETALRAAIEYWAGPVGDHGYRDPEAPHYRLIRLGGREMMTSTFERFAVSLDDALTRIEKGEAPRPIAHQIAGIAGMMGYAKLGQIWSLVDQGMTKNLPDAQAATRDVLARLNRIQRN